MFKWLYKKKGCAKHMNNKLEVIGIDHGWSMMKTIQSTKCCVTCNSKVSGRRDDYHTAEFTESFE